MWPEQFGGLTICAEVGRTGAPISTAESQKETYLGLSSNPVAPTLFRSKPFGENVEGFFWLKSRHFSHVESSSIRTDMEQGIFLRFP